MNYHYTTIDTLDAILSSKSIKFNKLTNLDDRGEDESFIGPFNPKEYFFVSSWSKDPQENITLWSMYTHNKVGVRIGLKDMPFPLYPPTPPMKIVAPIDPNNFPWMLLPFHDAFTKDYYVMSVYYIKTDFEKYVQYLDEKELQEKYIQYALKSYDPITGSLNTFPNELGAWKSNIWEAQKEFRFVLNIYPQSQEFYLPGTQVFIKQYIKGIFHHINTKTRNIEHFFLPLCPQALANIEVLLSPYAEQSDFDQVEQILQRHGIDQKQLKTSNIKIRKR